METKHVPVLLKETITGLEIKKNDIVLDATLGGGGHSQEICEASSGTATIIGLDADQEALDRASKRLSKLSCKFHFVCTNFRKLGEALDKVEQSEIDKALFDLGLGSHTYTAGRGFSFQKDEPLMMTFAKDPGEGETTAYDVVNTWSEETLREILWAFGDERYARTIAHAIIFTREKKIIETSSELAEIIRGAVPASYRFGKIHPATKTFQAIRIAVNDELTALEVALKEVWQRLKGDGRVAVISFHSLEDRIVKRMFRSWSDNKEGLLISKKPIVPTEEEIASNPRSRSAKLRIIQKINL